MKFTQKDIEKMQTQKEYGVIKSKISGKLLFFVYVENGTKAIFESVDRTEWIKVDKVQLQREYQIFI
jgi:hypothetical protein